MTDYGVAAPGFALLLAVIFTVVAPLSTAGCVRHHHGAVASNTRTRSSC